MFILITLCEFIATVSWTTTETDFESQYKALVISGMPYPTSR